MSALAEARDIVDGLTRDQVREACLLFVDAVAKLDADGDAEAFIKRMREAATETERMALGVAA